MSQKYLDKSFLGKKTWFLKDKKNIQPKKEPKTSFNKNQQGSVINKENSKGL